MLRRMALATAITFAGLTGVPAFAQNAPAAASAQQSPVQVVQSISDQLGSAIDGHQKELAQDKNKLIAVINEVFLPKIVNGEPLYVGFFHTGAYQESLGGYGGIQHCLIPAPKHVIIDRDEDGEIVTHLFSKEQSYKSMLKTLGY